MEPKKTNFNTEKKLELADRLLLRTTDKGLDTLERLVLKGTLENKSYQALASEAHRSPKTLKDIGSQLWKRLSLALAQPVKKSNVKARLESVQKTQSAPLGRKDWADAPDVSTFFGRETEITCLKNWILRDRCRLVAIVGMKGIGKTGLTVKLGMGGIGKTGLSLKLAQGIQEDFDYVIWRSVLNAPSLDHILQDIIQFLSDQQETRLSDSLNTNLITLLKYLKQHRCLIVLDNVESILMAHGHDPYNHDSSENPTNITQPTVSAAGQYQKGYEDYGQLFQKIGEVIHQSCCILTSREKPKNLQTLASEKGKIRFFQLHGLKDEAAKNMFARSELRPAATDTLERIIRFYEGNPLALNLALKRIQSIFNGNIVEFLAQENPFFEDINDLLNWHFNRLSWAEKEILYWLAINREPMSISAIRSDCLTLALKDIVTDTLESLQRRLPINRTATGFSLQPVIIEYLTEKLIKHIAHEIQSEQITLLNRICLQKGTAKDYTRKAQQRLILLPLIARLHESLGSTENIVHQLNHLLQQVKATPRWRSGYAPGNLLSLFCTLDTDLTGYDFSHLTIRQSYLQDRPLRQVNFSHADLSTAVFTQSFGGVHSTAFSPDGQYLAIGDSKGEIRLLRQHDYQQVRLLTGHGPTLWITAVAFAPQFSDQSPLLVSSSFDATVRVWNVKTGNCLKVLSGHTHWIWSVDISPDSRLVASGGDDGTAKLWDVETGECLHTLSDHSNWVWAVAFSPDGKTLATGSYDHTIRLWDTATGACLTILNGHDNSVWALAFSPDGTTLVSSSLDHTLRLWDMETKDCLHILKGHTKEVRSVAFSPDGNVVVSGSFDGSLKRWDVKTGHCLFTYVGHRVGVRTVAISPDGQTLVSGDHSQSLRLWDLQKGHCLQSVKGYINWVWSMDVRPQSRCSPSPTVVTGGLDGSIRLWNIETGHCIQTLDGHDNWIWQVAFSPDGKTIASCSDDESIKLWDIASGQCLMTLKGHTDGGVWAIDFSLDGKTLISGGQDGTIRLWSMATAACIDTIAAHNNWIWAVLFDQQESQFFSCSDDGTIKLWTRKDQSKDESTKERIQAKTLETYALRYALQNEGKVMAIALHNGLNLLVSGHNDGSIRLWNSLNGEHIRTLIGHQGWVLSLKFWPGTTTLISSAQDKQIRHWNVETGECLGIMTGHQDWATSLVIADETGVIVSGSADETLRVWDLSTYQCLKTIRLPQPYDGMNIHNVIGLSESQRHNLLSLGAIAKL